MVITFYVLLTVVVLIGLLSSAIPLQRWYQQRERTYALQKFRSQRELLEAKFLDLAQAQAAGKGLRWKDVVWSDQLQFGRDKQSGLLTAFAGITLSFEAIAGGDMEDVPHVGLTRDACALFHYQYGVWGTGGRALFNMNPKEALEKLSPQYDAIYSHFTAR